jgi:hypothetical protein
VNGVLNLERDTHDPSSMQNGPPPGQAPPLIQPRAGGILVLSPSPATDSHGALRRSSTVPDRPHPREH